MPNIEPIFPVRWSDGRILLLDQTALPAAEVILSIETVADLADAIRRLSVRGAPALGVAGAFGVALAVDLACRAGAGREACLHAATEAARHLDGARPTAVNLRWALDRSTAHLMDGDRSAERPEDLRDRAVLFAQRILDEDLAVSRAMADHGCGVLPDPARVLTHCNTGALATGGGGTALGVVIEAARRGRKVFVHVDETRPLLQGARLTSWELMRAGIDHVVQCDGAAAWALGTGRIDVVLVGADRIAGNGDTANKVGTLGVAVAAREFGIPFYVVAPRSTVDTATPQGGAIPIEERDGEEVSGFQGVRIAPTHARAWNPAFDVTPARFISGWITERGVERPPFQP